jgi:hypothetical protein
MPGQLDDIDIDLRAPLSKFFEALAARLQDAHRDGKALTGPDSVLDMMHTYIGPALMDEAGTAGPSGAATRHLVHLALVVVDQAKVPEEGTGSGPYRRLNSAKHQLNEALGAARRGQETDTDGKLDELIALVKGLSDELVKSLPAAIAPPLSADLVQSLPGPIADAVVAAFTAEQDKAGEDIAKLKELAATPLNTAIKSPADGIEFLQEVYDSLSAVEQDALKVPSELVQPITNVVLGVFNFVAQSASIDDLNAMNELKQEIADILQPPAPARPAEPGGIQLCRRAEQPTRWLAGRHGLTPSGLHRGPRRRSTLSRLVSGASPTPFKPGSTPRTVPARPSAEAWRRRSTGRSPRCFGRCLPTGTPAVPVSCSRSR